MTNATYKLLTRLSKQKKGATFDEILEWGYFDDEEDLNITLSVLDNERKVGHLKDKPGFHVFGPGEEALRMQRYLRQNHFIAWGTFITATASLLTAIASILISLYFS